MPFNFLETILYQGHAELLQSLEVKQTRLKSTLLGIQKIVPNWHQLDRSGQLFALRA